MNDTSKRKLADIKARVAGATNLYQIENECVESLMLRFFGYAWLILSTMAKKILSFPQLFSLEVLIKKNLNIILLK